MGPPASQSVPGAPLRLAAHAMGTRFEVILSGNDPVHVRAAAEAALEEVGSLHQRYSAFARDSLVTRINTGPGPTRIDAETLNLLDRAEALRQATGGAFDITIGRAMARLGHRRTPDAPDAPGRAAPLLLDHAGRTAMLASPEASIDLGAIAKGYAIDAAVRMLRDAGVDSALVHAGGSTIAAIGVQHSGVPWTLTIPDPLGALPTVRVTLRDSACSVSTTRGDPSRPQAAHLIDPRTGEPAAGATLAAVVAPAATDTDAWATALCVLGDRPTTMPADHASILRSIDARCWALDAAQTAHLATLSTEAAP